MRIVEFQGELRALDGNFRETVESYAEGIEDAVERLRFIRLCAGMASDAGIENWEESGSAARLAALEAVRKLSQAGGPELRSGDALLLLKAQTLGPAVRAVALGGRWRMAWAGAVGLVLAVAAAVALNAPAVRTETPVEPRGLDAGAHPVGASRPPIPAPGLDVWLVETQDGVELYSNGLEIRNDFLTHNEKRRFAVFAAGPGVDVETALRSADWRSQPVGIVYHTTVSEFTPPLEPSNNQLIRHRGRLLLRYLAREKLYNLVIDRFGRVWRLVPEDEIAYHAGHSMWAENGEFYLNLNDSFIGVAFETRPEAVREEASPDVAVTAAQKAAARLLTEMLRERYGIPEANAVTHEMVSINPEQMLIGYHTDWAGRFPFAETGLPDNYESPPPSVAEWGFTYDSAFVAAMGGNVWSGLAKAEANFRRNAVERGATVEEFRRTRAAEFQRLRSGTRRMRPEAKWLEQTAEPPVRSQNR